MGDASLKWVLSRPSWVWQVLLLDGGFFFDLESLHGRALRVHCSFELLVLVCGRVATSYLQGKHGVEIRNECVNKDNSHLWVRISHVLYKMVTDLKQQQGGRQQRAGNL